MISRWYSRCSFNGVVIFKSKYVFSSNENFFQSAFFIEFEISIFPEFSNVIKPRSNILS